MRQSKDDLSRSLVALDQNSTVISVIELSSATWLVGGIVPGIARDPLKKLVPDQHALLKLLYRWRDEAIKAGSYHTARLAPLIAEPAAGEADQPDGSHVGIRKSKGALWLLG